MSSTSIVERSCSSMSGMAARRLACCVMTFSNRLRMKRALPLSLDVLFVSSEITFFKVEIASSVKMYLFLLAVAINMS